METDGVEDMKPRSLLAVLFLLLYASCVGKFVFDDSIISSFALSKMNSDSPVIICNESVGLFDWPEIGNSHRAGLNDGIGMSMGKGSVSDVVGYFKIRGRHWWIIDPAIRGREFVVDTNITPNASAARFKLDSSVGNNCLMVYNRYLALRDSLVRSPVSIAIDSAAFYLRPDESSEAMYSFFQYGVIESMFKKGIPVYNLGQNGGWVKVTRSVPGMCHWRLFDENQYLNNIEILYTKESTFGVVSSD